jgi:hypothetical protein
MEGWVNESSAPVQSVWIEARPKSLIEFKGVKVIGVPGGLEWGSCG